MSIDNLAGSRLNVIVPVNGFEPDLDEIATKLGNIARLIIVVNDDDFTLALNGNSQERDLTILHLPFPRSPYSARNFGLKEASAGPMAFLDASCMPAADWVQKGLEALASGADVVAGKVEFRFQGAQPTAAELWDSVSNIQQEHSVGRGVAKTANLFVSERALAMLGPFKEGVRSGEDVRWTGQCTSLGLQLKYAGAVVVYKRARTIFALLRKSLRTGAGKALHQSLLRRLLRSIRLILIPPSIKNVARMIKERSSYDCSTFDLVKIWFVAWGCSIFHGIGMLLPNVFHHAD